MVVYKLTNLINGMSYVGQTTHSAEERFKGHKQCKTSYIGRAIQKYGAENFSLEVLAECKTKEELDEQEMFFIDFFDSKAPNGYNLTDGGEYIPYLAFPDGDDWVIVYRSALASLALDAPLHAWKVFGALSSKQEFERGIKTTKKAIADEFNISYDNVIRGFSWLKEHGYVKERKVNGQTEFLLNPSVTTCGRNKQKKIDLWNSV